MLTMQTQWKQHTSLIVGLIFYGCTDSSEPVQDTQPACLNIGLDQAQLWQKQGSPIQMDQDVFAPSLLVHGEDLWLYFSARQGMEDTIFLTTSPDGESWSTPELIHDLNDFSEIKHLNISSRNDSLFAMIGGGRIGSAESRNGVDWFITGEQIVPTAAFDQYGQLYPSQSQDGDTMWYSGFNGSTFAIGVATRSNDQWAHQGPVIEADPDSRYRNTAVAQPSVLETDGRFIMWYGGYDTSQTDPGPWRILTAHSDDMEEWHAHTLALDLTASGEEAWSVREPSVVSWNNQLWMAYIAMGEDAKYRLRVATCSADLP